MRNPHAQYAAGMVLLVAAATSWLSWWGRDVRFCRMVVSGLVAGKLSVRNDIAWERFKALEVDVGKTYAGFQSRQERAAYEEAFITKFAEGFRQSGATPKDLTNWRKAPDGRVVVDYPKGDSMFALQAVGGLRMRLAGIERGGS